MRHGSRTFRACAAALVCFAASTAAVAGEYMIDSFTTGGTRVPQPPNDIIAGAGESPHTLAETSHIGSLSGETLILRRSFGTGEARLYRGTATAQTYDRVSTFKLPRDIPMEILVRKRFFENENPVNPAAAEQRSVYFGLNRKGEYCLYVPNKNHLHFRHDGRWRRIDQVRNTGTLTVSSRPRATAHLDGEQRGDTPIAVDGLSAGRHRLLLEAPEFETLVIEFEARPGETFSVDTVLTPASDRDGDLVPDGTDRCPEVAGHAEFAGCPDSHAERRAGAKRAFQWTRRVLFASAAVGASIYAVYQRDQERRLQTKEDAAYDNYLASDQFESADAWESYVDAHETTVRSRRRWLIAAGAGVVSGIGFIVSIPF